MLEVLLQPLLEGVGDLVELVELADTLHSRVVPVTSNAYGFSLLNGKQSF